MGTTWTMPPSNIFILVILGFLPMDTVAVPAPLCPDMTGFRPTCACTNIDDGPVRLFCDGNYGPLTQDLIDSLMSSVRSTNNVPSSDWLDVDYVEFMWGDSALTTFDLTPFIKVRFNYLQLSNCDHLTVIKGPEPVDLYRGLIEVDKLRLSNLPLGNEGLGQTLKYFHPKLSDLSLWFDGLEGGQFELPTTGDWEFLPGLSAFTNLTKLNLGHNVVQTLVGESFKNLTNLIHIQVGYSENFRQIDAQAFIIDEDDEFPSKEPFQVWFTNSGLTGDEFVNIDSNSSIFFNVKNNRPALLNLRDNFITYLAQEFFEPFLDANDHNRVDVNLNLIFCSPKFQWLKARPKLQLRIDGCVCSNDPGRNCFDSFLIDE